MSAVAMLQQHKAFPVSISKSFAQTLLNQAIGRNAYKRLSTSLNQGNTSLDIWTLPTDSNLYQQIKRYIDATLFVDAQIIRIHRMQHTDSIEEHIDNAYPDHDTIVIRLDDNADPRFLVDGETTPESQGTGVYLPEGTPHAVVAGKTERYTLTIWVTSR